MRKDNEEGFGSWLLTRVVGYPIVIIALILFFGLWGYHRNSGQYFAGEPLRGGANSVGQTPEYTLGSSLFFSLASSFWATVSLLLLGIVAHIAAEHLAREGGGKSQIAPAIIKGFGRLAFAASAGVGLVFLITVVLNVVDVSASEFDLRRYELAFVDITLAVKTVVGSPWVLGVMALLVVISVLSGVWGPLRFMHRARKSLTFIVAVLVAASCFTFASSDVGVKHYDLVEPAYRQEIRARLIALGENRAEWAADAWIVETIRRLPESTKAEWRTELAEDWRAAEAFCQRQDAAAVRGYKLAFEKEYPGALAKLDYPIRSSVDRLQLRGFGVGNNISVCDPEVLFEVVALMMVRDAVLQSPPPGRLFGSKPLDVVEPLSPAKFRRSIDPSQKRVTSIEADRTVPAPRNSDSSHSLGSAWNAPERELGNPEKRVPLRTLVTYANTLDSKLRDERANREIAQSLAVDMLGELFGVPFEGPAKKMIEIVRDAVLAKIVRLADESIIAQWAVRAGSDPDIKQDSKAAPALQSARSWTAPETRTTENVVLTAWQTLDQTHTGALSDGEQAGREYFERTRLRSPARRSGSERPLYPSSPIQMSPPSSTTQSGGRRGG